MSLNLVFLSSWVGLGSLALLLPVIIGDVQPLRCRTSSFYGGFKNIIGGPRAFC